MRCQACGSPLDAPAFPSGVLTCACGVANEVAAPASARAHGDPYRAPSPPAVEASVLTCPFCGGPCTSEARHCPHCNVELASLRCPECFALHFAGARFCSRCTAALTPEPLLDATDAPCPRCDTPLRASRDVGVTECGGCGGLFVDHSAFAALAAEREAAVQPFAAAARGSVLSAADTVVHYVKCPMCSEVMNRLNFGRRSNVIVDVCRQHGTWFDAGELTRVLEWVASGGWMEARIREREHHDRENAQLRAQRAAEAKAMLESTYRPGLRARGPGADTFVSLLKAIFSDD